MARKKKTRAEHAVTEYQVEADRPAGERWVTMSHALTRAGQGLSLAEKRLVMACIAKLDSRRALIGQDRPIIRLHAREYAETYDLDPSTAYIALKEASEHLFERRITFFQPIKRRNGKGLDETITKMRWIDLCRYTKSEGCVELRFVPDLLPALTGLKDYFTTYQLQQASALRSVYSWRLLELLMQYKKTGWAEFEVFDFATSMDAPEAQRRNFGFIRRRIIDPAVKELKDKDGWDIEWKTVNAGRRVRAVRFSFSRNPQERLPLEEVDLRADAARFEREQSKSLVE